MAILGLVGLCAYLIRQRTKEIGIRKVLGATFLKLFKMVSSQFHRPVLVGFAISLPTSYFIATEWLAEFSYRTEFSWMMVLIIGVITVAISSATIFVHSHKVARTNPAAVLKED